MKPADLARSGTESGHQRAVFCWAAVAHIQGFEIARQWMDAPPNATIILRHFDTPQVPELKWLHHIPNGGARGEDSRTRAIRGNALKAEGVRSGVSDLCLPVKRGQFSGLYIEMKKPGQANKTSPEQKEFGAFVQSQGFAYRVCDNYKHAIDTIEGYLSLPWTVQL